MHTYLGENATEHSVLSYFQVNIHTRLHCHLVLQLSRKKQVLISGIIVYKKIYCFFMKYLSQATCKNALLLSHERQIHVVVQKWHSSVPRVSTLCALVSVISFII